MIMNKRFDDLRYEITKNGMEHELTNICKRYSDLGLDKYLVNGFLNQGYSLTLPYHRLPLLVYFEDTCQEIKDILEAAGTEDQRLNDLQELTNDLIMENLNILIYARYNIIDWKDYKKPTFTEREIRDVQAYIEKKGLHTKDDPEKFVDISKYVDLEDPEEEIEK